jgi:hypothetical protein
MTDTVGEADKKGPDITRLHGVELSNRELYLIGHIVAQWGALEHEVFVQTLLTFGNDPTAGLPKEMNNMNFLDVLKKWKERVVALSVGEKKCVLEMQYDLILHYHDYRNALVHGMWDWDAAAPRGGSAC